MQIVHYTGDGEQRSGYAILPDKAIPVVADVLIVLPNGQAPFYVHDVPRREPEDADEAGLGHTFQVP